MLTLRYNAFMAPPLNSFLKIMERRLQQRNCYSGLNYKGE